jgi:hypothetical protein
VRNVITSSEDASLNVTSDVCKHATDAEGTESYSLWESCPVDKLLALMNTVLHITPLPRYTFPPHSLHTQLTFPDRSALPGLRIKQHGVQRAPQPHPPRQTSYCHPAFYGIGRTGMTQSCIHKRSACPSRGLIAGAYYLYRNHTMGCSHHLPWNRRNTKIYRMEYICNMVYLRFRCGCSTL